MNYRGFGNLVFDIQLTSKIGEKIDTDFSTEYIDYNYDMNNIEKVTIFDFNKNEHHFIKDSVYIEEINRLRNIIDYYKKLDYLED